MTTNNINECRLLKLAPELRNHIWHFMSQTYKTIDGAIEIGNKTAQSPAILLTCKQIRGEMLQMYHHDDSYQYTDGGNILLADEGVPLTKWLQRKHDQKASIKQLTLCFEEIPLGSIPECHHGFEWVKESVDMRSPVMKRHAAARTAAERILNIILDAKVPIEKLMIKGPEWIYSPQYYLTMNFGRWWTRAMLECIRIVLRSGETTLISNFYHVATVSEEI